VNSEWAGFWQLTDTELAPLHPSSAPGGSNKQPIGILQTHGDPELSRLIFGAEALSLRRSNPDAAVDGESILARLDARDILAVPWRTAAVPLESCGLQLTGRVQRAGRMGHAPGRTVLRAVWQGYAAEQRAQSLQAAELDRLEAHAQRMAALERQKSEFLQLASHELRAPITLVSGYLSMLEEGSLGELPGPAAKVVPVMTARMRHMSELVDGCSPPAGWRFEPRSQRSRRGPPRPGPRCRCLGERDGRRSRAAGHQSRAFATDPDSSGSGAGGDDPSQSVSNAVKYSPEGREVTVAVREEPEWVAIDVTDHGDGITEADLQKLFQPFGRLQSAIAAGIQGTGLGLHLSRGLAQAQAGHRGRVAPGRREYIHPPLPRGRKRTVGRVHA